MVFRNSLRVHWRIWIPLVFLCVLLPSRTAGKDPKVPLPSQFLLRSIAQGGWVMSASAVRAAEEIYSTRGVKETEDCVFLSSGDRVSGRVIGIGPESILRIEGPRLLRGLRVHVDDVQCIIPARSEKIIDGPDWVTLANGDSVHGEVQEITGAVVLVKTESMGVVKIRRSAVASVNLRPPENVFFETDFSNSSAGPWRTRRGAWEVRDGKYHALRGRSWVSAEVRQEGPVTVEWTTVRLDNGYDSGGLSFFIADTTAGHWGQEGIYFRIFGSDAQVYQIRNNGPNGILFRTFRRFPTRATFRAAYDPETGRLRFWVNGIDMGVSQLKPIIKRGRYIHLYSGSPSIYESVRLIRGAPGLEDDVKASEKEDKFVMTNRDKVSGTLKSYADGAAVIETLYGTFKVKRSELQQIVFRKSSRRVPRRKDGMAWVSFHGGSSLIASVKGMDAEAVDAVTDATGEIRIRRGAIRRLIYSPPGLALEPGSGAALKCVLIPPGRFVMGPPAPPAVIKNRVRIFRREVTITRPFLISASEVTRGQFAAFVRETSHKTDAERAGFSYIFEEGG
ncbi:MAG: SUMF1/EgtB/PvdO family nonheme iron enzyme, partial [Phycisphaerae bacterium]|nr:SUMF1/EgtB/PvdO family nonheme iron enzyme [Phycisphaerae bacterium]